MSLNLSGINLSGSSQYCMWVLVQVCNRNSHRHSFWIVRSLMVTVLVHRRTVLYTNHMHTHNYSAVHYIIQKALQCCRRVETKRLLYHHFQIFDSLCSFIDISILFETI